MIKRDHAQNVIASITKVKYANFQKPSLNSKCINSQSKSNRYIKTRAFIMGEQDFRSGLMSVRGVGQYWLKLALLACGWRMVGPYTEHVHAFLKIRS